ncbi:PadR family transcriptional regulator, partial [Nocardioides bruguierae]
GPGGRHGHHGPHQGPGRPLPPWVALLGLGGPGGRGGLPGREGRPPVRRGDVRIALLAVLVEAASAEQELNGYQAIQRIGERTDGAWRPSPGSVYPTVAQLEDEGLVVTVTAGNRRRLELTYAGRAWADEHAEELAQVWAPFDAEADAGEDAYPELRAEVGQLLAAVWQVAVVGSAAQREAAAGVLADVRRRLYGILAEPGPQEDAPAAPDAETESESEEGSQE